MANTSRINGFRPTKYLNGAEWNGQANLYFIPNTNATATFVGDLVKQETTGDATGAGGAGLGVPSCIQASVGGAVLGAVMGFIPGGGLVAGQQYINLNTPQYRAASVGVYCWVVDDPMVLFEVQNSNGTSVVGDAGNNANIAVGTGSTATGQSGMTGDVGTLATTATLQLRVVAFSQRADNDPTSAASKWLVKLNNHAYGSGTGTAGI